MQSSDPSLFLKTLNQVWEDYTEQMNTIRNIFLYLDRYTSL